MNTTTLQYRRELLESEFLHDVTAECERARQLFPSSHMLIIALAEESGEVVKAINDLSQGKSTPQEVRKEIIQCAAMCLRLYMEGDPAMSFPPIMEGFYGYQ